MYDVKTVWVKVLLFIRIYQSWPIKCGCIVCKSIAQYFKNLIFSSQVILLTPLLCGWEYPAKIMFAKVSKHSIFFSKGVAVWQPLPPSKSNMHKSRPLPLRYYVNQSDLWSHLRYFHKGRYRGVNSIERNSKGNIHEISHTCCDQRIFPFAPHFILAYGF